MVPPSSEFLLKLDITDAKSKVSGFLERLRGAEDVAKEATRKISEILVKQLRLEAPVGTYYDLEGNMYEGGALRDSISYTMSQGRGGGGFLGLRGAFQGKSTTSEFTMASHGKYTLPPGTKPHPIFPRSAPFLVFYYPKTQQVVRRGEEGVEDHPGYIGDPWDTRAVTKSYNQIFFTWAEEFERWRVSVVQRAL